jgi:transposase
VSRYDAQRHANAAKAFPGSEGSASASAEAPSPDDESNAAKAFAGSTANAAKTFPGSAVVARSRFTAAAYRTAITEKLDAGLSLQRIWQDLVEEFGYSASYQSVKRFVHTLALPRRVVGVLHCAPGAEGQVDFFRGAPTLIAATGEWRRPWVFRMTLGHSRHGYEEAVWDQQLETFLRLHERAFHEFGGVPQVMRHDNLKARSCARASMIPIATTCTWPSPRTGALRRSRRSRGDRSRMASRNAVAVTSKTTP